MSVGTSFLSTVFGLVLGLMAFYVGTFAGYLDSDTNLNHHEAVLYVGVSNVDVFPR